MKNDHKRKKLSCMLNLMLIALMYVLTACQTTGVVSHYDLTVQNATTDFYVNDFANVLDEQQKAQLMSNAISLDNEYAGIQVVITTVESLESAVTGYQKLMTTSDGGSETVEVSEDSLSKRFSIEEITYSMYSQYGIGLDDMGVLILLSIGDREVRIETGYQMQNFITDAVSGQLLDDYGIPYFSEDKFAEGLVSLQTAVISEIKERVPQDWQDDIVVTSTEIEEVSSEKEDITTEGQQQNLDTGSVEKNVDSEKGFIASIFSAIAVAIIAFGAMIRNIFTGKTKYKELEEKRENDLVAQEEQFRSKIECMEQNHQREISSLNARHSQELCEKEDKIRILTYDLNNSQSEVTALKTILENIEDKYARVQSLHPEYDFETEVNEMIEAEYKIAANDIDCKLASAYATSADKDNIDIFRKARILFDETPPEVRKYITSDRKVLENLYSTSVAMQKEFQILEKEKADKAAAVDACNKIRAICNVNQCGNHETYEALDSALKIFKALTTTQRNFFPDEALIRKLKDMHGIAENDYNNYKAAKEAEKNVENIMKRCLTPDEDDRDDLDRAMRYYRNLTLAQQKYFSEGLLSELKKMIRKAESDYEEQERRRRERRNSTYNSSYSSSHNSSFRSGGSSSFGGHGGRPSGGGASRGF